MIETMKQNPNVDRITIDLKNAAKIRVILEKLSLSTHVTCNLIPIDARDHVNSKEKNLNYDIRWEIKTTNWKYSENREALQSRLIWQEESSLKALI